MTRIVTTSKRRLATGASAAAVLGPIGYLLFFRHWCLTWGARDDEVAAKLPGDELLPDAGLVTTRAITPGPERAQRRQDPAAVSGHQAACRAHRALTGDR
jgi:hypothetical protein